MTNFEFYKTKEAAEKAYKLIDMSKRMFETIYNPSFVEWLYEENKEGYKREDGEINVYTLLVKYPGSIEETKFRYFDEACERINKILKQNKMFTLYSQIMKRSSFEDYKAQESISRKKERIIRASK